MSQLIGIVASSVEIKPVPCSVLNMTFFNKLKDPKNGVVHESGIICKRYDMEIENFLISDNLRAVWIFITINLILICTYL